MFARFAGKKIRNFGKKKMTSQAKLKINFLIKILLRETSSERKSRILSKSSCRDQITRYSEFVDYEQYKDC